MRRSRQAERAGCSGPQPPADHTLAATSLTSPLAAWQGDHLYMVINAGHEDKDLPHMEAQLSKFVASGSRPVR